MYLSLFVLCFLPQARAEVRIQIYIWFMFFLADWRLISMLWISLQVTQWWRSTMCVCHASLKQFRLCTLDNVAAVLICQRRASGTELSQLISTMALCFLDSVWNVHSNTATSCCCLIDAVAQHESLLLSIAYPVVTGWLLQWSCY